MNESHYDAVVIGAGQGGAPLAAALADAGRRTALVEREHLGGTCVNTGCTPTKTMIASARVAHLAGRARDFGVSAGTVSVDLAAVRRRKQGVVESFRAGSERRLADAGVELISGAARFVGPRRLRVTDGSQEEATITADQCFINTGARPARPRIPGLETVEVLDSASVLELDRLPDHLVVIGGGYIGLEFAQMFRRFGSAVTLIQRGSQLLSREDPDVAAAILEILRDDGVDVRLDTEVGVVGRNAAGQVRLVLEEPGGGGILTGSHLLVATGRTPNTADLGLEAAGVEVDERGYVRVGDRLETTAPGVYALGDVKGGPQFTHISFDDFRVLRTNLIEGGRASTAGRLVPYTVFTDPQLGRVGMSESEATRAGRPVRVARLPMSHVARAIEMDETRGFIKAVVDADTDRLLGCAVLGVEGGEIMSMLQIAILGGLPYQSLREGVFAHPTLAESLNNLFGVLEDRTRAADRQGGQDPPGSAPAARGGVPAHPPDATAA